MEDEEMDTEKCRAGTERDFNTLNFLTVKVESPVTIIYDPLKLIRFQNNEPLIIMTIINNGPLLLMNHYK